MCRDEDAPPYPSKVEAFKEAIAYTNVTADDWVLRDDAAAPTGDAGVGRADGVVARDVAPLTPAVPDFMDLTPEALAVLAELQENPLPGARYAYTVVKRDMGKVEAAAAKREHDRLRSALGAVVAVWDGPTNVPYGNLMSEAIAVARAALATPEPAAEMEATK